MILYDIYIYDMYRDGDGQQSYRIVGILTPS